MAQGVPLPGWGEASSPCFQCQALPPRPLWFWNQSLVPMRLFPIMKMVIVIPSTQWMMILKNWLIATHRLLYCLPQCYYMLVTCLLHVPPPPLINRMIVFGLKVSEQTNSGLSEFSCGLIRFFEHSVLGISKLGNQVPDKQWKDQLQLSKLLAFTCLDKMGSM